MFNDGRSRRIVFFAHCILNQNAISDGTAVFPAAFKDVLRIFLDADVGIVQLPCPELCCLGLDRGDERGAERPVTVENTRIRREMSRGEPARRLAELADSAMYQIGEYRRHGFELVAVVGMNRSPNCGVDTTSDDGVELQGMGLFMSALSARLKGAGISIPFVGLRALDNFEAKLLPLL